MKKYCLLQLPATGEVCWVQIPANMPDPKMGDESHQHPYIHVDWGVVIGVIEGSSPAGELLGLIEHLSSILKTTSDSRFGADDYVFKRMLEQLLADAIKGSEETTVVRSDLKALCAKSASA